MVVLQVEHTVPSFEGWKKMFDSDPIDRKKSRVLRYRIYRSAGDPNNVVIDLEFDSMPDAEAALEKLRNLWKQAEGKIMMGAKARILSIVESKEY